MKELYKNSRCFRASLREFAWKHTKYTRLTRRFPTEYLPELRRVLGLIESSDWKMIFFQTPIARFLVLP